VSPEDPAHGAFPKVRTRQHRRKRFGLVRHRVGHSNALGVDEVPTQIRARHRNADSRQRAHFACLTILAAAKHVRRDHQRRRRHVQQPVNQTDALGASVDFAPIGEPGHRGTNSTRKTEGQREICRAGVRRVSTGRCLDIEGQCRRPGANRNIREDRVKRVVQPHTMQGVLDCLTDRSGISVRSDDGFAEWFGDAVEFGLVSDRGES